MDKKYIFIIRVVLLVFAAFTQVTQQIINCNNDSWALTCLSRNKYLSIQSNLFAIVWLALFVYYYKDESKINKLYGKFKGAVTVYLLVVMFAYWALLSNGDNPVGWYIFTNISQHYVVPLLFLIDTLLFEENIYEWGFIKSWILYPTIYALFAIINGVLGWELGYVYGFLDIASNGWGSVLTVLTILYALFFVLSSIIIKIKLKK